MNRPTVIGRLLQLDNVTWSTIDYQQLRSRTFTVFFAYAMFMWNRFGGLVVQAPRPAVRFLLIGMYSWLALAIVVWLASGGRPDREGAPLLRRAAVATAIVHVPLVALAFFMAIVAGFARVLGPGLILAIFVVGLWMPALLVRIYRDVVGWPWSQAVLAATGTQLLWLLGPGRFLFDQVGHLL